VGEGNGEGEGGGRIIERGAKINILNGAKNYFLHSINFKPLSCVYKINK
jgi:hypothetical protein